MSWTGQIRTVFREGERLTANRLNAAFDHARASLRRTLVGPLSPGVALGLTLRDENGSFAVDPGIAIDRRGRVAVVQTLLRYTRDDLENIVGPLGDGDRVRVGIRVAASPSNDPCGPAAADETERAEIVFRRTTPLPGAPVVPIPLGPFSFLIPSLLIPLFGATVNVGTSCTPAWGDLDVTTNDPDGCSVQLGTISALQAPQMSVNMDDRQGIAPRFDALRNSFDQIVMELRTRGGVPRVNFVAPAGGPDVQATRLAYAHSTTAAARVSPSSGQVVEFAGGTPKAPTAADAPLSPGYSGVAAIPVRVHPDSSPIAAGDVVLLASLLSPFVDDVQVAGIGSTVPGSTFGIAAAASRGSDANRVVPVATAGVVLATIESADISANAPLTPVGATNVLRLASAGDVVVAHAARGLTSLDAPPTQEAPVWIVHPARVL